MGAEFQFRKVENLGDGRRWELHNNVNVPRAAELYSYMWLKQYILCDFCQHTIPKLK